MSASEDEFHDICTLVGLMTLSWAWVETCLTTTIGVINRYAGPIKGYAKPPKHMEQCISCFEVALAQFHELHSFQEVGSALIVSLRELSRRRNNFIHGAGILTEENFFEADIIIRTKVGQYDIERHRFNKDDAVALNIEIGNLSDSINVFMLKICSLFEGRAVAL